MKKGLKTSLLLIFMSSICATGAFAQLTVSGQLRIRTELREGQANPQPIGAKAAFFTAQRTRLSVGYNMYRLKFNVTAQDVRVWGQDVSTINRTTTQDLNGMMLHEAWADLQLTDTVVKNKIVSLKIGRQELVYDDQRLLGNLDWLQQARRHDAAVLKFETKDYMLHLGGAYNQNRENLAGTLYNSNPPGPYAANTNAGSMYKSLAYLYAGKKLAKGTASFLLVNDNFSKFRVDPATQVKTFDTSTWNRMTTGLYYNNIFNKLNLTASAYYQLGKNANGQSLRAHFLSTYLWYTLGKKFTVGAGVDVYSGGNSGTTSNTFDPLYGTPHKFSGYIDYFFAPSGFGRAGLVDYYVRGKFKASEKFLLSADVHQFNTQAEISGFAGKNSLGQEIDIVANYTLTKQIGFEAGYARYYTTALLASPAVKNIPNVKPYANWAYLSINVKPEFFVK